jgi:hypothetical protein
MRRDSSRAILAIVTGAIGGVAAFVREMASLPIQLGAVRGAPGFTAWPAARIGRDASSRQPGDRCAAGGCDSARRAVAREKPRSDGENRGMELRGSAPGRRYTKHTMHFVAWRKRVMLPSHLGRAGGHVGVTGCGHPAGFADVPLPLAWRFGAADADHR